jgi:hypothetical protein
MRKINRKIGKMKRFVAAIILLAFSFIFKRVPLIHDLAKKIGGPGNLIEKASADDPGMGFLPDCGGGECANTDSGDCGSTSY